MSDRPVSNPDLYRLPAVEYNKCLQDTYAYFKGKTVKLKNGLIGEVIGVDPRPQRQGSQSPGIDGNWLVVRLQIGVTGAGCPITKIDWAMPDDVTIVENPSPKEQELKT